MANSTPTTPTTPDPTLMQRVQDAFDQTLKHANGGQYQGSLMQQANYNANQIAQNQLAQNQSSAQLNAMDAIRRANASAIASGANQGLAAAQQLQSVLGMQSQASADATQVATDFMAQESANQKEMQNLLVAALQGGSELINSEAALKAAAADETLANTGNAALLDSLSINANTRIEALTNELSKLNPNTQAYKDKEAVIQALQKALTSASADEIRNALNNANSVTTGNTQEDGTLSSDTLQNAIRGIDSITGGWTTGDDQTFVTRYYDWKTGTYTDTGATQRNQKGFNKSWVEKQSVEFKQAINRAQNNGGTDPQTGLTSKQLLDRSSLYIQSLSANEGGEGNKAGNVQQDGCVVGETLITLSNGTQKPIKDLKHGELVLSYNSLAGDVMTTLYTPLEHPARYCTVLRLVFSNGYVDTVDGHSFCLENPKKVIALTLKNAHKYVGKTFIVGNHKTAVLKTIEQYAYNGPVYSPIASKYIWLYTNGILSTAHLTEFITQARIDNPVPSQCIKFQDVPDKIRSEINGELFDSFDGEMLKYWAKGFKKFTIGRKIKNLIKMLTPQ